jgi:fatty acid desaturase
MTRLGTNDPVGRIRRIEWPTLLLAATIYGGWMAVTWWHSALPLWLLVPAGGWLVAWHGSLQHETIHGHPTGYRFVDSLIGAVPLSLWLPYAQYRRTHLAHHATRSVTDPAHDPEARYLAHVEGFAGIMLGASERLQSTLAGRLLLGPLLTIARFLLAEMRRLIREPAAMIREWLPHLAGLIIVGWWLALCDLPVGTYLLAFVYPATSLTLLRSFAEHRAHAKPGHRVAIIEQAGPLALLFLNNNLHAAHHRAPNLAWYRLPALYRRHRAHILRQNGALLYRGYGEIVRRYLFRPHDMLIHPDHRRIGSRA